MNFISLLFWFLPVLVTSLDEGEECVTENQNGKCLNVHKCNYVKDLLKVNKRPQLCGFQGRDPIVCCPRPSALNVEGKSANRYREKNSTQWLCGGTLISEHFVLTAAHCLYSQDLGDVSKVRLGELDIKSKTDDAKPTDYEIAETFAHPDFKSPSHYNDIALIKLDREVSFSNYIRPACLYTKYLISSPTLIGTGWGQTDFLADTSSHLIKVDLDYIDHQTCAKSYSNVSTRKLKNGIIDEIQICAGAEDGRDACPGDSGGPLQVKSEDTSVSRSHYSVVGITSFGKACGAANSVGVYTRVAPFTAWIENIVWP